MDPVPDSLSRYQGVLLPMLQKLKKNLSARKQKDLRDLCSRAIDHAATDLLLQIDSYFPFFKQVLDQRVTKLTKVTLRGLQRLVANGFLLGTGPDTCQYEHGPQLMTTRGVRRLIDGVVEGVCGCVHDKEDGIHLEVVKTLLVLVTGPCQVHDRHLLEAFRACYHIYITSKSLLNQTMSKAALRQMLHTVFHRMETVTPEDSEEPREDSMQKMLRGLLRNLVDDVCLFAARTEQFPAETVPIRAVPYTLQPEDPLYQSDLNADVVNEEGHQAGKFGWCVVCRKAAESYCTDLRDPVCSLQCRQENCVIVDEANKAMAIYISDDQNDSFHDAHLVLKSICKLSMKDIPNSNTAYSLRSKALSLELILSLLERAGQKFCSKQQFVDVIRSVLCSSLVSNCLSADRGIFTLSLALFVALMNSHKDHLKPEIGVFLEQIFLRILESENSSYHHKLLVLQVIYRLTQNPRHTLELFSNYDCDLDERDIVAQIMDVLAKVAQGKYLKSEHLLQPLQEEALRMCALETLTHISISIAAWIENDRAFRAESLTKSISEDDASSEIGSIELSALEKSKQLKGHLARAVHKFNFKAKTGIRLLAETGYLDPDSPQDIAAFLKTTEGLNKTAIGDYLGSEYALNKKVLYSYVDLHDFAGMDILQALRHFLASFRIPGEAQKTDRVIEKFSEKYFRDNAASFEVADTAYVLSFAIIMLQTDMHNPAVKNKMTIEGFKSITRGINNGKDLPEDYLRSIYDSIKVNPLSLLEDEDAKLKADAGQMNREDMFEQESRHIQAKSQEIFRRNKRAAFQTGVELDHIKPFFETTWPTFLATFAVVLEESENQQAWKWALQGFLACCKTAAKFALTTQLEGFVSALANFTSLSPSRSNHIREKNIEAAKVLLLVAKSEANSLRKSWRHVLYCLSRLDYLQLVHSGVESTLAVERDTERMSVGMATAISPQETDYIFSLSATLDDEAVVEFVQQLIEVSKGEIGDEHPRIFSLQAIVTVADVNMARVRLTWARLWAAMQEHFIYAGLHSNEQIAIFALDSLRQLSSKFLMKDEFANFHFQREFLMPFPRILQSSQHESVKEMLIDCINQLIFTQEAQIRSGWNCIFQVLLQASQMPPLLTRCFKAISHIVEGDLGLVLEQYEALLNTLLNCAEAASDSISIRALELIPKSVEPISTSQVDARMWSLFFKRMAVRLNDARPHIQTKALESLFTVLLEQTDRFDQTLWQCVWNVLMQPLFVDLALTPESSPHWVKTTFQQALLSYVELTRTKSSVLEVNFDQFLHHLQRTALSADEGVARVGVNTLLQLGLSCGPAFTSTHWTTLIATLTELLEDTLPVELSTSPVDVTSLEVERGLAFNADNCVTRSVVHLLLVSVSKDILEALFSKMQTSHHITLLCALSTSHSFARDFNKQIIRRWKLWKAGFMKDLKTLPGLLKQERESLTCYLTYLFQVYAQGGQVWTSLLATAKELLQDYLTKETRGHIEGSLGDVESGEAEREVASLRPIITKVLIPGIVSCKEGRDLALRLKTEILQLVLSASPEVRAGIKTLLDYAWT